MLSLLCINGPKSSFPTEVSSPAMYFEKYFTPELFETFAFHTTLYYNQTKNEAMKQPLTPSEIKKFFGIHGFIGCFPYPRLKMYWGKRFQFKAISDAMSRDRFF